MSRSRHPGMKEGTALAAGLAGLGLALGAILVWAAAARSPGSSTTVGDAASNTGQESRATMKRLTPQEQRVIVYKGTESPFSGKYYRHFEKGVYTCKRCGAELFESSSKFHTNCGWPSFDDRIPGAVKWQPEPDGRTEILCANCGAHLGHVFVGEQLTPKNTRYCVNSVSMDFLSAEQRTQKAAAQATTAPDPANHPQSAIPDPPSLGRALFASGCFWGTEYHMQRAPGVISTTVGYTGGRTENPTYKQVCTGRTGHAETVEVIYDPTETNYEQLAKLFFETHDFTQLNRQGPDIGTQYRSAIFYLDNEQRQVAQRLVRQLRMKGFNVKTQIAKAGTFWPAEDYHQDYYNTSGKTPYCHVFRKIFEDRPTEIPAPSR
ncbi:MAG: bifunctional methionine sulfoxide reductase B/A protein [Sedimentisphaerales bacterium]|nr:bifunctional methionine sulfoxide reductase B/A protein [Sedimentisphaerales bacterium]